MDTYCVRQSDIPKYIAHVLGRAVSKKYRQHHNYDAPKYVAHVLGGAVSKMFPENRNHRHKTGTRTMYRSTGYTLPCLTTTIYNNLYDVYIKNRVWLMMRIDCVL